MSTDESFMQLALELALRGEGFVEPNPTVGCVMVFDGEVIGKGFHQKFGEAHAEINAIADAKSNGYTDLSGATAYVTLEPCSHTGKTGPCSKALIDAKLGRVVVACQDSNPKVSGRGIEELRSANIQVDVGVLEQKAKDVMAPYLKRMQTGFPWVIAKWAMTLDGKIASYAGDSKWISNPDSRAVVHQIRGRVDGVMVGIGTVLVDDPGLDARPPGARVAKRIVVDSAARISLESKLVKTANQAPVLVAVGPESDKEKIQQLRDRGCEVFESDSTDRDERLKDLLKHLAENGMTNVLVEGGGRLLGSLHDNQLLDEVHVFIGAKVIGGANALSPIEGEGVPLMNDSSLIRIRSLQQIGSDIHLVGTLKKRS